MTLLYFYAIRRLIYDRLKEGSISMNPIYFIAPIFWAITSLVHASVDDSLSSRSSSSSRALLQETEQLTSFQRGVNSVAGYAALVQKVEHSTGDETEPQVDINPYCLLKNFLKALEKGSPGLYGTLPPKFFEEMGKSVAKMWVTEAMFSFDILKIWDALLQSKAPEVVNFLITNPIQEGDKLYEYVVPNPTRMRLSNPIKFDKVATHFSFKYRLRY